MARDTQPDPDRSPQPSPFDRFQALARRILTTPKSELVKEPSPVAKPAKGKRKSRG